MKDKKIKKKIVVDKIKIGEICLKESLKCVPLKMEVNEFSEWAVVSFSGKLLGLDISEYSIIRDLGWKIKSSNYICFARPISKAYKSFKRLVDKTNDYYTITLKKNFDENTILDILKFKNEGYYERL